MTNSFSKINGCMLIMSSSETRQWQCLKHNIFCVIVSTFVLYFKLLCYNTTLFKYDTKHLSPFSNFCVLKKNDTKVLHKKSTVQHKQHQQATSNPSLSYDTKSRDHKISTNQVLLSRESLSQLLLKFKSQLKVKVILTFQKS